MCVCGEQFRIVAKLNGLVGCVMQKNIQVSSRRQAGKPGEGQSRKT